MNCIDCDHPVEIHTRYGCMHETKTDDGHILCECFKGKQEVELEAARARIAELEAALQTLLLSADVYAEDTPYAMKSAREQARTALKEMKP